MTSVYAGVFAQGILVLVLGFNRGNWKLLAASTVGFALLIVQVLLGVITITNLLEPIVVTAHLAGATAFLIMMTLTAFLTIHQRIEGGAKETASNSDGTP
ncbi:MAG: hypothetical protein LN412_01880 [Candidatus Thermoplasmatota archaeon]|nr:hypothetical protein [Candidatus Thermoplasmatota archaeon]